MEPIALTRERSTLVVETKPVPENDRGLLMSIVEPTLALQQEEPGRAERDKETTKVPVGAGIVLAVPMETSCPGFVTPKHGPIRFVQVTPPSLKRGLFESDEEGQQAPPPCRESLGTRFDLVVREDTVVDLRGIAEDLAGLKFEQSGDQQLLAKLGALISKMADDLAGDDNPDLNRLLPLTRSLRRVVVILSESARGELLRDTLCVFSGHAHELSGRKTPQEDPPTPLQLLLSSRRLTSVGVVPVSPAAGTYGKCRRTRTYAEPQESGGPLSDGLTTTLELLVNATAEEPFAPDEVLLSIGKAFIAVADSIRLMGDKVPGLANVAFSLIPRLAKLKEFVMRLPPGLTEQAIHHLQALATEAQAEAAGDKTNPVCITMIRDMNVAVEQAGGALALLGEACARLVASDPDREDIKRLSRDELGELWKGLLWMGDAMAPVVDTVTVVQRSLTSLDACIDHMERSLPPGEVLHTLGTIMEESLQASRTVARLVKPNPESLLPRLMDSVAHVTELANEARAAMDAVARARAEL